MAEEKRIKISELPDVGESLDGFFTVGTKEIDGVLTSVKANLGFVKQAADGANEAADGANEAAERAEAAADSLKDIEPYSDEEWDEIIHEPSYEKPIRLYTEAGNGVKSRGDFLTDDFARRCGYDTLEDMVADYPNAALTAGCQKFEPTGAVVEYEGELYELWKLFMAEDGAWTPETGTGELYGLLRAHTSKQELIAKSMMSDINNRYEPFSCIAIADATPYTFTGQNCYNLVYVE